METFYDAKEYPLRPHSDYTFLHQLKILLKCVINNPDMDYWEDDIDDPEWYRSQFEDENSDFVAEYGRISYLLLYINRTADYEYELELLAPLDGCGDI